MDRGTLDDKHNGVYYLSEWTFIDPEGLPIENYAPAILVDGDKMYYTASHSKALFETDDPKKAYGAKSRI